MRGEDGKQQAMFSYLSPEECVPSERLLMEQLDYNLLFCWPVGLGMDEPAWTHAVFSNLRRLARLQAQAAT